jgi:hypothetical protein
MLEFLGNLFIGKPLNVLAVAAVFVVAYLVRKKLGRQNLGHPRWLLAAHTQRGNGLSLRAHRMPTFASIFC